MSERDLTGAVVVVTGASSGAARAAAESFAAAGARVVLAARGAEALTQAAAACRAAGGEAMAVPTDVGDPDAVQRLAAEAVRRFGHIDIWVNAAAVVIAGELGSESTDELRRLVDTNVGGVLFGSRAALAVFRRQRCGTLINVSSMLGLTPNPLVPAYVMSKFAVRGLSLSLRQATKAESGIHVCVVLPGSIDTPLFERAANHTGRRLRAIPPAMAPERVAAAIVSCARKPRRQVPVGGVARLLVLGHRLAPRLVEAVVASTSTRLLVRREQAPATSGALFSPPKEGRVHGGWRRGRLRRHIGKCVGRRQARA